MIKPSKAAWDAVEACMPDELWLSPLHHELAQVLDAFAAEAVAAAHADLADSLEIIASQVGMFRSLDATIKANVLMETAANIRTRGESK